MLIKLIILILMAAFFLFEVYKHLLSARQRKLSLPRNVRDIYDDQKYQTWSAYSTETNRVDLTERGVQFALTFLLLLFNVHARLSGILPQGMWANSILLVVADMLIAVPIGVYFAWVQQMRVEEKYGFNRSTKKTFITDQIKQVIIGLVLMTSILCLYILFYEMLGLWGFILLFAALAVIITLITTFSMQLSKLFNKYEPLPEGELRSRLEALFEKHGYTLRHIYVMDASKRTSKINAYCTGLGKNKEISLYDNLVANYTPDEITAVFAHELAHFHFRDTMMLNLANMLTFLPMIALLLVMSVVPAFCQAFGFTGMHYGMVYILMGHLMQAVLIPVRAPVMAHMRACEYRADAFAVQNGYGEALVSALKRLCKDNLADLNPHPLIVTLEHSHPTLSQRIAAVSALMAEK